ncbi:MAG TPA: hypothetical protein VIV60_26735 [Polyangiaceae bacterium]
MITRNGVRRSNPFRTKGRVNHVPFWFTLGDGNPTWASYFDGTFNRSVRGKDMVPAHVCKAIVVAVLLAPACSTKITEAGCCDPHGMGLGCEVMNQYTLEQCKQFGAAAGCDATATELKRCTGSVNGQPVSAEYVCCSFKDCNTVPACGENAN